MRRTVWVWAHRLRGLLFWALCGPVVFVCAATTEGTTPAWESGWDAMLYAYPSLLSVTKDSVLNPGNRLAALAESSLTGEARLNVHVEDERFRFSARPIFSIPQDADMTAHPHGYLSQWQARALLPGNWAATVGREVMTWGPSQFRSPSSPFYFDNGRANPLRELSGVDTATVTWTPDRSHALTLAYVPDGGHRYGQNSLPGLSQEPIIAGTEDPWRDTWLLHGDLRGEDWTTGLVLAQPLDRAFFVGSHLQWTWNDAWLLYGEVSSSTLPNALISSAEVAQPFSVRAESPRRQTGLVGATWTLENGQSVTMEYLYNGHGYTRTESQAYFARAATSISAAALALTDEPPLLNQHYLHLVWQNNLLEGDEYWRLMMSRNLEDDSSALVGYFEHALDGRLTLFAMGVVNLGGARREFSSLIEQSFTLGLRLALP